MPKHRAVTCGCCRAPAGYRPLAADQAFYACPACDLIPPKFFVPAPEPAPEAPSE